MKETSRKLTSGLTRGKETEVLKALQLCGVTVEEYEGIGQDPVLALAVADLIRNSRCFTPPVKQVEKMLFFAQQVWKDPSITQEAIAALGEPPLLPLSDSSGHYCVTLIYETGDTSQTIGRSFQAFDSALSLLPEIRERNADRRILTSPGINFEPTAIQLRPGARSRSQGLRWIVAELGRKYQEKGAEALRAILDEKQIMGLGPELLGIAAMHPRWALSLGKGKVFAPDLVVIQEGDYLPPVHLASCDLTPALGFFTDDYFEDEGQGGGFIVS